MNFDWQDGGVICRCDLIGRYGVYLDNCAIIGLAKAPPGQRDRFLAALREKGTLLFSMANAAEIGGPQGRSSEQVASFLRSIGRHWLPLEMNPWEVERRERLGEQDAPLAKDFIREFALDQFSKLEAEGTVITTDNVFDLSAVVLSTRNDRGELTQGMAGMDATLQDAISDADLDGPKDAAWLDANLPVIPFGTTLRAGYVLSHLTRILYDERKNRLKKGDGIDLCHAAMAVAYARLVVLDGEWQRRVSKIPRIERMTTVFYPPQMEDLIATLERLPAFVDVPSRM